MAFNLRTPARTESRRWGFPEGRWTELYGGMEMLAEFSVVPIGEGESVSRYVAECIRIVESSGLRYKLNPMGTVVEGEYDAVMAVVRECHMKVMTMASRVITTVKVDDRKGVRGAIDSKVESVQRKLENE